MNNLYNPRERGCTASKGKVFDKGEDTSHRFGSKDLRGDKGATTMTKDHLARDTDAVTMMVGMMYYDG